MSCPSVDLTVTTTTEACALSRTCRHISFSWVTVVALRTPAKSFTQSVGFSEEIGSAEARGTRASATHTTTIHTTKKRCRAVRIAVIVQEERVPSGERRILMVALKSECYCSSPASQKSPERLLFFFTIFVAL